LIDDNYYVDEQRPIDETEEEVIPFSPLSPQQLPQYGPELPVTYTPIIYVYDAQSDKISYNFEYTDYFINFLTLVCAYGKMFQRKFLVFLKGQLFLLKSLPSS
jgi:hypothetical protein